MSRSDREDRAEKRRKYASVKDAAQKMASGFTATYLKLPSGVSLWKPKAGKHYIDILPYEVGDLNQRADAGTLWWEFTYYVHRGIGANNETFICPARTLKKKCPICDFREKLRAEEDEDDEKVIKSLATKQRQLINLRDLKDEDKGIQLYEVSNHLFGDKLMEDIVGAEEEEGWDLFFTLEDGKTVRVTMVDDTFGGRSFVRATRFDFKDRDEPYKERILDEVHDLETLIKVLPYDELKEKFMAAPSKDEDEDEKPRGKKPKDEDEDEPPKRKRPVDDDDDEPKKKKPAKDEDDDGWDDEPKKKPKDEDDEDEKPRGKKPAKDEEDEDEPKSRKKPTDDDDDWDKLDQDEEKPKRGKKDEEDEDEKPRRKPKDEDEDEKPRRKPKDEDDD